MTILIGSATLLACSSGFSTSFINNNKKLIRRWDSERELRTTLYTQYKIQ